MTSLNLGVIGNGTIGMLVDDKARIVWGCFPRFDSDPVFDSLVNGSAADHPESPTSGGFFAIEIVEGDQSQQHYLANTAILCTRLSSAGGGAVEVVDFAPRYAQHERMFRPPMVVRLVFPVSGKPRIRIRLRPRFGWGAHATRSTLGSNHIRYFSDSLALRLTTNTPLSYIDEEVPFVLDRPIALLLGSDEGIQGGVEETARMFHERTIDHWRNWARSLSIPFEWQEEVIRAAITLKLCNYEETGAIVAALTTSIPEAPFSQRTWDYRYCWPRDAYFVIHALNRLGATRTMEDYLNYIANIVADGGDKGLRPVYGITRSANLEEREAKDLCGYRGMGPVRIGNQATVQVQNDVYGSVVLAATHRFFDRRLSSSGSQELYEQLEVLGRIAVRVFGNPDAGLWELRGRHAPHTFSSLMCWAACDRLAKIAHAQGWPDRERYWRVEADGMHAQILRNCWSPELNTFVSTWGGTSLDASLLLLHELDFLKADDPAFSATVEAIGRRLLRNDLLLRYAEADDFGVPETAFTICTFWYIDALMACGRRTEARALFEGVVKRRNPLGLFSEDIHPETGELWGNFPQTYSMVGLINSAMRLSKSWEEAF